MQNRQLINDNLMLLINTRSSLEEIKNFIRQNPDIDFNYVNKEGNNYLHECFRSSPEVYAHRLMSNKSVLLLALIPILAANKVNPNIKNLQGMTVLELVMKNCRSDANLYSYILMLLYHDAHLSAASNPESLAAAITSLCSLEEIPFIYSYEHTREEACTKMLTRKKIECAILEIIREQQENPLEKKGITMKSYFPTIAELLSPPNPVAKPAPNARPIPTTASSQSQAPHSCHFSTPASIHSGKPRYMTKHNALVEKLCSLNLLPEEMKDKVYISDMLTILGITRINFAKDISLGRVKEIATQLQGAGLKCTAKQTLENNTIDISLKIDAFSQWLHEFEIKPKLST